MYANMLNRLKNYFGIENIFVESSIHKMELFKVIHKNSQRPFYKMVSF